MDCDSRSWPNPAAIITFEDGYPAKNPWAAGEPRTEEIKIGAYSSERPKMFNACKSRIAEPAPGIALNIEHVGSTAVPGLPAKPVIDIDLIVRDPDREEVEHCIAVVRRDLHRLAQTFDGGSGSPLIAEQVTEIVPSLRK